MKYKEIYSDDFLRQFGNIENAVENMELDNNSYSIDVDSILGYCHLNTVLSDKLHAQGGIDGHVVYISPDMDDNEKRFREAHGIGHYVLGHIGDAGIYREETERAADEFAMQLLTPEYIVKLFVMKYVKENGISSISHDVSPMISSAAKAEGVPEIIIRRRMKELGIITEEK